MHNAVGPAELEDGERITTTTMRRRSNIGRNSNNPRKRPSEPPRASQSLPKPPRAFQDAGAAAPGPPPPASAEPPENGEQAAAPGEDVIQTSPPEPQSLTIEKVAADKWKEGYGNFRLRSDVAKLYSKLHAEVKRRGAILTSSGGIRSLTAAIGAARSATSFHYTGRALDLYIYSCMVNPATDPYVAVRRSARVYQLYARCNPEHAEVSELQNVMTYQKRNGSLSTKGSFFDLTALFAQHGFKPIHARSNFESGGSQLGAEFWHFQCERGLIKGQSTFGDELQAIYSEETLRPTPPWGYRDRVFGVNWG